MPLERSITTDAWRDVIDRLGLGERTPTPAPTDAADTVDPGLQVKVAFLESPRSYPEPTTRVDTVETHLSFVFLTDRFAYKLKKPMRLPYLDLRTVGARKRDCDEELRLNRRLTRDVYLDCVSLSQDASGGLRLGADGTPVDWLVRMRRLPADRMLDRLVRDGRVRSEDLRRVVAALARCYREGGAVVIDPVDYRRRFADGIEANEQVFAAPKYSLPAALSRPVSARQRDVLAQRQGLFDERVRAGRIVDGHGDLRPEHICLEPDPQIIDCLAFSRDLRVLDTADELGFLALECERLGAPELARDLLDAYGNEMGDAPPPALVHFYQSYRACVRAKIALWHLDDPVLCQMPQWPEQARDYLRLARLHVAQCP